MVQLPANRNNKDNQIDINRIFNQEKYLDENRAYTLKDTNDAEFLSFFYHKELLKNDDKTKPLSELTKKAYQNDGKTVLEFLKNNKISLRQIGDPEVAEYCDYIKEKYAIRTAIRKLDFFRRLLHFGFVYSFYPVDFSGKVSKPKTIKGHFSSEDILEQNVNGKIAKARELKDEDAKEIIQYFEDVIIDSPRNRSFLEFLKIRNRLMGLLLFRTGARSHEILNMTFGSFYKEEGALYVDVVGKGKKPRAIPILSKILTEAFSLHKQMVKEKFDLTDRQLRNIPVLFSPVGIKDSKDIKPLSYNNFYKIVKKAVTLAEQKPEVSPHWFRHTYITFLLSENVPLATVKDIAGHSDISTTNIYLEEIDKRKKHKQMSHIDFD